MCGCMGLGGVGYGGAGVYTGATNFGMPNPVVACVDEGPQVVMGASYTTTTSVGGCGCGLVPCICSGAGYGAVGGAYGGGIGGVTTVTTTTTICTNCGQSPCLCTGAY